MSFEEMGEYKEEQELIDYENKKACWDIGIGLQKVDNLFVSSYLVHLAELNSQNKKSYTEIKENLDCYYKEDNVNQQTREADLVALNVSRILSSTMFSLSPATLLYMHKELFTNVFDSEIVGNFRKVNITKEEAVLSGKSVQYASADMIQDALKYDFEVEREFSYRSMEDKDVALHVMKFLSSIWQIHPFREGNTRTIAVFGILYLRSLNFSVNNEPFKKHSLFFRNALVLDNTFDRRYQTGIFLKEFTDNLLFEGKHDLSIDRQM